MTAILGSQLVYFFIIFLDSFVIVSPKLVFLSRCYIYVPLKKEFCLQNSMHIQIQAESHYTNLFHRVIIPCHYSMVMFSFTRCNNKSSFKFLYTTHWQNPINIMFWSKFLILYTQASYKKNWKEPCVFIFNKKIIGSRTITRTLS